MQPCLTRPCGRARSMASGSSSRSTTSLRRHLRWKSMRYATYSSRPFPSTPQSKITSCSRSCFTAKRAAGQRDAPSGHRTALGERRDVVSFCMGAEGLISRVASVDTAGAGGDGGKVHVRLVRGKRPHQGRSKSTRWQHCSTHSFDVEGSINQITRSRARLMTRRSEWLRGRRIQIGFLGVAFFRDRELNN